MHAYATACACMRMHTSSPCFSAKFVLRMKKSDVSVTYPLHLPGTLPAPTCHLMRCIQYVDIDVLTRRERSSFFLLLSLE